MITSVLLTMAWKLTFAAIEIVACINLVDELT